DVADYYFEVERWDRDVGVAVRMLEERGELDNTIIVMTGDHNMPFPRCKGNLYDSGSRVPLAVRWGARVKAGRTIDDFVSLVDLTPTFLDAAGVPVPAAMTGRSLMNVLLSDRSGQVDPSRDFVLIGKERHGQAQEKPNPGGYPSRAIRTGEYLYIRNFAPDRWPGGAPDAADAYGGNAFGDCDGGPAKTLLIEHRDDPAIKPFFDLAFAKRPAEELYDLSRDPEQLHNVAAQPQYAGARQQLSERLTDRLRKLNDPRVVGGAEAFDSYPYRRPSR
ncbi:MAG: sulfatase-like hydrolase/transferase, partial [Planctomycetes bacterium]|nr:sulfatase-like hydrolase/transferase [Planctomycetota bacterium]